MLNHIIERRRRTGHLQSHIEALYSQLLHRTLDRLAFRTIDGYSSTHLLGYLQSQRVDVRHDDIFCSGVATYSCCHRTDESGSGNEYIFAQDRESEGCVGGVAEGIHDRCEVIGYLVAQFDDVRLRYSNVLRETPIFAHDSDGDGVLTDVSHATAAVSTMSTDDMSFRRDAFADRKVPDTFAHFSNHSYKLMPHRIRRFAVGLRPLVPFIHVQVGATDSGFRDLDQYIVDSHLGHRHFFHPDARLRKSLYKSFHNFLIYSSDHLVISILQVPCQSL